MARDRLLIIGTVFIAIGLSGIFGISWRGSLPMISGAMISMVMGGDVMGQGQMKAMIQEMMSGRLPLRIQPEDLSEPDSPEAKLLQCARAFSAR